MGRFEKGKQHARADMWGKAGGVDAVANALRTADVLNRNTEYSSEMWSHLSMVLFDEDIQKNRHWLWVAWTKNRKGLRDRIHLTNEESEMSMPENVTEGMEPGDQGVEMADVKTQYDTEVLERERGAKHQDPGIDMDATNLDSSIDMDATNQDPDMDMDATNQDPDGSGGLNSTPEAIKLEEREPELNVWRQCPKVKRTFYITMERKSWNMIRPQKGSSKLRQPWTTCLYDLFKKENPCCTLSFKYQHVKAPQSRKRNIPYLRMSAVCTFPSCTARYSFIMQKEPAKNMDKDVEILVNQTGDIQHKLSEKKSRPATILKRGTIAKALFQGPSNHFYTKLQSTPTEQLLAGNMSECLSKNVLKVIGSEMRTKESAHKDILMEVYLMQTILKECDPNYFKIPGYIQHCSMNPFFVHLYTELGISILVHHLRGKSPVSLYLDATGGVVSKIPDQPKRVLYYALALPGKDGDAPPLPILEMLSNDHSVPPITFWLMQFTLHLTKYTQIPIHQVETDYSWALIQSVMLAFNKEHIISYLNRAYDICMGKKSWDDIKSRTILHICAAHILKAVRQAISKQTDDKGLIDFVTFAFARMQNASSLTESGIVFRALCALLTTPQNTKSVKDYLAIMESVILRCKTETLEEDIQSEDWEMWESEERKQVTSIIGNSPFYAYFQKILKEVKEQVAGEICSAEEDNPYFCPGILNVLFDTYLAIYPLWSGLLLGDLRRYGSHEQDNVTTKKLPKTRDTKLPKTRDTNCHIERWFGIVKHSIMQKKKKVRPGTFLRKMYQSLQARYLEHIIQHQLNQELLLKPLPPGNLEQSRETWMKRSEERFPTTKSKFFSVPQNIPAPQKKKKKKKKKKKRIHKDVTKIQKSSSLDPFHCHAEAIPVEEEINMLWRKPPNELVVAIVKSDNHNLEFLLHHKEFLTLKPHGWLFGETIECYLRAVLNAKGANLYQLSHYTTDVILNGTRERMARQGLSKVNFEQYDGVISVVNIKDIHWRFVYLHAITNTIFVLDPQFGTNEMEEATQACQKFGEYFKMSRNQYGREDRVDTVWKPGTIQHSFQEDDFSCGVFVMLMAKQVVDHFPKIPESLKITPSQEWMCHTRTNVAKEILQASVSRQEYCSVCGQKDRPQTEEHCYWIQCKLCQRWYHAECLNIVFPLEERPWFCALCV